MVASDGSEKALVEISGSLAACQYAVLYWRRETKGRRALPAGWRYDILVASKNVRNNCRCENALGQSTVMPPGYLPHYLMAAPQVGASSADLHTRRDKRLHRAKLGFAIALRLPTPTRRMGLRSGADATMTTNDERAIGAHNRATEAAKEEIARPQCVREQLG